ncbi:hypothetical protein ACHAO8_011542 [Botrytis cinerea]
MIQNRINKTRKEDIERSSNFLFTVWALQLYDEFVDILSDYERRRIDISRVLRQVARLFQSNPSLLQGFGAFLPPGITLDYLHQIETTHIPRYEGTESFKTLYYSQADLEAEDFLGVGIYISSTISQDQTSGEAGRLEKILEHFHSIVRPAKELRDKEELHENSLAVERKLLKGTARGVTFIPQERILQKAFSTTETIKTSFYSDISFENHALALLALAEVLSPPPKYPVSLLPPSKVSRRYKMDALGDQEELFPMRSRRVNATATKSNESSWDLAPVFPSLEAEMKTESSARDVPVLSLSAKMTSDAGHESNSNLTGTCASGKVSSEVTKLLNFVTELEKLEANRRQDFLFCVQKTTQLIHQICDTELKEHSNQPENTLSLPGYVLILHRVTCDDEDGPSWITRDVPSYDSDANSSNSHLRGSSSISDLELYLGRHPWYLFVVFQDYECNCDFGKVLMKPGNLSISDYPENRASKPKESIGICSKDLCDQFNALVKDMPDAEKRFPNFGLFEDDSDLIQSPYLFYYHNREFFSRVREDLSPDNSLGLLLDYISQSVTEIYKEVDDLLSRGILTADIIPYLFAPTTTIVSHEKDQICGYVQREECQRRWVGDRYHQIITLPVESWSYNGKFTQSLKNLEVNFDIDHIDTHNSYSVLTKTPTMKIQNLSAYPLRFASEHIKTELLERGKKFWKFRKQKFVLYTGLDYARTEYFSGARFMIDTSAYQKMHRQSVQSTLSRTLSETESNADEPPGGDFLLLLPLQIFGFHMQDKKWVNLQVALTEEVVWHEESFESLVIDPEAKELIIALITNKLEAERNTDVIPGKGNGLIILLHGGPGTGKTLTAESVAEIAKKPLYRVTCGDIGTTASDVEKVYLDTVLTLGKMWKCVVLLDEADVFLEQRSLADLERNALVSVFLRVLEYYDGILILTSNRVGTFDEAFKSRIQLALHYDDLKPNQRKKIWQNFIARLEATESDSVDITNLLHHIDELAKPEMNGREIRNAVTTARQLALHKSEKMNSAHLKHVIRVAGKFEKYLQDISEGTDEEIAREMKIR